MMLTYTPGLWESICGMFCRRKKKTGGIPAQVPEGSTGQNRRPVRRKKTELELEDSELLSFELSTIHLLDLAFLLYKILLDSQEI